MRALAIALLLSTLPLAAQADMVCTKDSTQLQHNFCASTKFKHADSELNETYQAEMKKGEKLDQARLRGTQRAWVRKVHADCHEQADAAAKGEQKWAELYYVCLEKVTRERIKAIRK